MGEVSEQTIHVVDGYVFFLATAFVIIYALTYLIYSKDISETLAVIVTSMWALYFGLEDIFVYGILGYFRDSYPWLRGTLAGWFPTLFGAKITTASLFLNMLITGSIALLIVYLLYNLEGKKWSIQI